MAIDSISSALGSLSTRKEKVLKAFSALDKQRSLISSYATQWQELEQYFSDLHQAIQSKFAKLSEQEKAFEAKTNDAKAALAKREENISAREQASLARVQKQKDAAINAILEEKKKLQEALLKKKELGSKSESKPAAQKVDPPSSKAGNTGGASNGPTSLVAVINQAKLAASEVRMRPQLCSLCKKMDGEGLRNYIMDHRKEIVALRNQLPSALQNAADPCHLVLKALEGYFLLELDPSHAKETDASAIRRACITLLECLAQALADPVLGVDYPVVPSNVKESARQVANFWRSKMDFQAETENGSSLDTQAFLQLLATFGIASDYSSDELCKLVIAVSRRKQTPALCRSLGLTAKIPGLVDKLAKGGKQIEALAFAHAFGIFDTVQPVPLLKAYLEDALKAAQALARNAPNEAAGQNDSTMKELSALKAVLRAIEEYKLASQYPTESLNKRVEQLEKAKADRKRTATAIKPQAKKPRNRESIYVGTMAGMTRAR